MRKIWKVLVGAENFAQEMFRELRRPRYPNLPEELTFLHAEGLLAMYPALPRKRRETVILQKYPAIFIIGIGRPLKDGYPHEMRAADYDDWVTDTSKQTLRDTHGLNGDILVWNHVTQRSHELTSMGIRVNAETLRQQLEMSNLLDNLRFPYHQAIINNEVPLSIGGGIGQSRTLMLLLRKAHLGEVSVTVWPKVLKGNVREEGYLRAGIRSCSLDVVERGRCQPPSFRGEGSHLLPVAAGPPRQAGRAETIS